MKFQKVHVFFFLCTVRKALNLAHLENLPLDMNLTIVVAGI